MRIALLYCLSVLTYSICIGVHAEDSGRLFYNRYLDSLNEKSEEKNNEQLNLWRATREAIRRNDRESGPAFAEVLQKEQLQFELLDQESMYTRGILKEIRTFRPARYIYMIEVEPYMVLISYDIHPGRSQWVESKQNHVLKINEKGNHD